MREAMVHRSTEANPGRCRARTSNPACGTLYRGWVRHPLASAIFRRRKLRLRGFDNIRTKCARLRRSPF